MTAMFTITLDGKFLTVQKTYDGKTLQSLLMLRFPECFSLSVNPADFSNTTESIKLAEEIITPYVKAEPRSTEYAKKIKLLYLSWMHLEEKQAENLFQNWKKITFYW